MRQQQTHSVLNALSYMAPPGQQGRRGCTLLSARVGMRRTRISCTAAPPQYPRSTCALSARLWKAPQEMATKSPVVSSRRGRRSMVTEKSPQGCGQGEGSNVWAEQLYLCTISRCKGGDEQRGPRRTGSKARTSDITVPHTHF